MSATMQVDQWAAGSSLRWPDGRPLADPFDAGLSGEPRAYRGQDASTIFLATSQSPWLVGFRNSGCGDRLQEFSRINLGFSEGGISSVAAGGGWVFAAGAAANRLVVLRLCYDWYQNRSRLLVIRVCDGLSQPASVTASHDGALVCVLHPQEATVQMFHCCLNGRLDLLAQRTVRSTATSVRIDSSRKKLVLSHFPLGRTRIGLESIFEKIRQTGTVRA